MGRPPRIRRNVDGTLDDVYLPKCEHFRAEQMDDDVWWFAVEVGGRRFSWTVCGTLREVEEFRHG